MKIKRFRASGFSEALKEIKKTFGEDAVILSSEQISPSLVEVVAAVDYEKKSMAAEGQDSAGGESELLTLRREIAELRDVLILMKKSGYQMRMPERKYRLLKMLTGISIREEFALRLCEKAEDMDSLIEILSKEIRTVDPGGSSKMVMLFGPTGSGKTSTIIKLASQAIKRGERIAIISLDSYKMGGAEQVRAYTRILNIPFARVFDADETRRVLSRFNNIDRVFIDTAGRHPSDRRYLDQLKRLCRSDLPIETHLIMSASSDNDFLTESYRYYKEMDIDCLGFTKLDESVNRGCIYNLSLIYSRPIAYLTTGQRIPNDILFPDSRTVARLILENNDNKIRPNKGVSQ